MTTTTATDNDLKRLEDLILNGQKIIEHRFNEIDNRLTTMDNRLTTMETRLTTMETRLIEVDNRLKVIENGQAEMKADVKTVQKDTTDLKIELTEVKGDIKTLDSKFDDMNKRLEKVEGTQKNQIWTLITVLSGSLLAVGFRSFFIDNNP
jgi:chromosome segregation ATPase